MILYVEQSDDDAFFFARSLKKIAPQTKWFRVNTLDDAKCYLKGEGTYQDRNKFPFPDLVIADTKLADDAVAHLFQWAKSQSEFVTLKFCLFTDLPPHLRSALLESAPDKLCFLQKPSHLEDWLSVTKQILALHPAPTGLSPPSTSAAPQSESSSPANI